VPVGNLFEAQPINGSGGPLSDPLSLFFKQLLKSLVIRMVFADPFESSVRNDIPFLRIGQKIDNALGEFIRTIKDKDLLADAKIIFQILSGFCEQTTSCTGHFEDARLDLSATVRQQPAKLNARVSEVQSDHRLTIETQKIRGRDRPCRPTVTEALDVDASGT
jgi:hypothetical protein